MWAEDEEPIGWAGVIAAVGAAGLVLAGSLRLAARAPGWPLVAGLWLAAGAMVLLLCRVTMPAKLRGGLVLAMLATMLFGAARADLFGVHGATDTMAKGVDEATTNREAFADNAGGAPSAPAGGGGAEVQLQAGRGGGEDWARDINAALGKRIGGGAARGLRITGSIDEDELRDGLSWVAIDWAISRDLESARCGRTSASGLDRATIVDAIGEPMAQAVARSISLGKVSCP